VERLRRASAGPSRGSSTTLARQGLLAVLVANTLGLAFLLDPGAYVRGFLAGRADGGSVPGRR